MDALLTLTLCSARHALIGFLLIAVAVTGAQAQGRMLPIDTTITSNHEVTHR